MDDISQIFALEVKQDLANRYFGFRKQIEDDTNRYLDRLGSVGKENIKLIIQDLLAIRKLLGKEALFEEFLDLLQYPKVLIARLIRDYGEEAGTAAANGKINGSFGFTKHRRLRNRLFTAYKALSEHAAAQHELFLDLHEEYDEICNKIQKFYRQNDLTSILDFLRQIDGRAEPFNAPPDKSTFEKQQRLEQDLRITPPPAVETSVEALKPPPPLEQVKQKLIRLVEKIP